MTPKRAAYSLRELAMARISFYAPWVGFKRIRYAGCISPDYWRRIFQYSWMATGVLRRGCSDPDGLYKNHAHRREVVPLAEGRVPRTPSQYSHHELFHSPTPEYYFVIDHMGRPDSPWSLAPR